MEIDIIFKIAGIGMLLAVICSVLKSSGKDEIATLASLAGLVLVLFLVMDMIAELFESIRTIFRLY